MPQNFSPKHYKLFLRLKKRFDTAASAAALETQRANLRCNQLCQDYQEHQTSLFGANTAIQQRRAQFLREQLQRAQQRLVQSQEKLIRCQRKSQQFDGLQQRAKNQLRHSALKKEAAQNEDD